MNSQASYPVSVVVPLTHQWPVVQVIPEIEYVGWQMCKNRYMINCGLDIAIFTQNKPNPNLDTLMELLYPWMVKQQDYIVFSKNPNGDLIHFEPHHRHMANLNLYTDLILNS